MKPEDEARNPGLEIAAKILVGIMARERMARARFEELESETAEFEAAKPQEDADIDIDGLDPCPTLDPDVEYSRIMNFEGELKTTRKNPKPLLRKIAQEF